MNLIISYFCYFERNLEARKTSEVYFHILHLCLFISFIGAGNFQPSVVCNHIIRKIKFQKILCNLRIL